MAIALCLLCFLCLVAVNSCLQFQVSHFSPQKTDIIYRGDAIAAGEQAELINKNNLNTERTRVGRLIYADPVQIWDSDSGKLTDFTSHFTFTIDTQSRPQYGHGIAFFLAPVGYQIPPNSLAGYLGLFNTSSPVPSGNQVVAVEFDSYVNKRWDPPYEHVGINIDSITSAQVAPWNASLHSGDTADVWVMYNASTKNLSVFWSYKQNPRFQRNSSLSYQMDLKDVLPEVASIGFTASIGLMTQQSVLKSWEFSSTLSEKDSSSTGDKKVILIVSTTVCTVVLLSLTMSLVIVCRRRRSARKQAQAAQTTSISDDLERAGPRKFSYQALVVATYHFSDARKLGEGGFGCVYKGYLMDLDLPIAVKKISRSSRQGKKEYLTEVKIISGLRHRNLVQLIGWCHEKGQFLLAYEFMPNRSLDVHLFGNRGSLVWAVRYKITLGLASALLYLHEECEQCVVHRDIKSSNIMLDSNFNTKLGDFGLARLMDHELGHQTSVLAGTFGYMAPEYVYSGRASKESDIYSFGVVILEIVTGRRSRDSLRVGQSEKGLVEWVWDLYGSAELLSAVDGRLNSEFDAAQVECLIIVGLWCAHPDPNWRPWIRQAIQVLNLEVAMPSLPTMMPVPVYHAPFSTVTSVSSTATASSSSTTAASSSQASVSYTSMNFGR